MTKYRWFCEPVDYSMDPDALAVAYLCYYYYLTKVLDLLDTVIRTAKNARKFPDLKGIYINYDRTPLQQQHFKRVRNELNARIANGETDLRIVYISGVPRVSKAKK
ncbi:hypothetical protein CBL_09953 [Carabus blaptoides fortunei]